MYKVKEKYVTCAWEGVNYFLGLAEQKWDTANHSADTTSPHYHYSP